MTPDEHRARAEELLETARSSHEAISGEDGLDDEDRDILAEVQALGTLAVAHALLAGQPPARHVPTNEVVDYPGDSRND